MAVEEHLAIWADLVSVTLLIVTVLVAGMYDLEWNPRRRVWGVSRLRTAFLVIFMALNCIFSVGRFIAEGVLLEAGPREFLLLSVIYSARWLWLLFSISKPGSHSAKAFKVARALRELKMIRFGPSTQKGRRGENEVMIRTGARIVKVKGKPYWRGVEKSVYLHEASGTHMVRLEEKGLHSNLLDEIGTVEFKRKLETDGMDVLYKKFYDVVITVDSMNPDFVVSYERFLEQFGAISKSTRQAQRVGATDDSDLGKVARRIAADAVYYIWHPHDAEFRTTEHVMVVNECVEDAAKRFLGGNNNV